MQFWEWDLLLGVTKYGSFSLCLLLKLGICFHSELFTSISQEHITMFDCMTCNNFDSLQMCFELPECLNGGHWFFEWTLISLGPCKLHFSLHGHEQRQGLQSKRGRGRERENRGRGEGRRRNMILSDFSS